MSTLGLTESRAQLNLGHILPVSMLLNIELIQHGKKYLVNISPVDTETTKELPPIQRQLGHQQDASEQCRELAADIKKMILKHKLLFAQVFKHEKNKLQVGLGSFHGAQTNTTFTIIKRTPVPVRNRKDYRESKMGAAELVELGENVSDVIPTYLSDYQPQSDDILWVREKVQ